MQHIIEADRVLHILQLRRQELLETLAMQVCAGASTEAITAFAMDNIQIHGALSEVESLMTHPIFNPT